ncbi:MAG: response regulator [Bacteroidota bacterium]|nr:response regulator [Bacteroidota bacterium]MDP4212703.1 response regulator [Bacteroidota bacterium]MDP4250597.1 response regulator [Bacteroidota bacterium]
MNPALASIIKDKTAFKNYILLAEDDIDDVELITGSLQNLGHSLEVYFINSGDKVMPFLADLPDDRMPGLMIMDYNLPVMSGYQILVNLSGEERYKDIPKIIWSTSNAAFFEKECLDHGASAYFVKPSDLAGYELLAKKIVELVRG